MSRDLSQYILVPIAVAPLIVILIRAETDIPFKHPFILIGIVSDIRRIFDHTHFIDVAKGDKQILLQQLKLPATNACCVSV